VPSHEGHMAVTTASPRSALVRASTWILPTDPGAVATTAGAYRSCNI
jgi:hypothetical protein